MLKNSIFLLGAVLLFGFSSAFPLANTDGFKDSKDYSASDILSINTSFVTGDIGTLKVDNERFHFMSSEKNKCKLSVKTKHGSPAKYVRVSTSVSGSIACVGGSSFKTDSSGEVTLTWSSGCSLKKIYVDGKEYKVDYKDGGSYSISMK